MKWKKPQEWKSGAAIIIVSRLRKGILSISAASASRPSGLERCAPFGVPVVPEVRMTKRGLSGGGFRSDSSPAAISCSSVAASLSPSLQPTTRGDALVDALEQPGELLVVDERLRPLAPRHLDQLRAGEHRVEVERAGAELGGGQGRLDEAAVVAAHDPDAVAVARSPSRAKAWASALERRCSSLEGERAALVDQCRSRAGGGSPRWRCRSPARRPSAGRSEPTLAALSGRMRAEDAGLAQHLDLERFVRGRPAAQLAAIELSLPIETRRTPIRSRPKRPLCRRFPRRGRSSPCPRWSSP